MRVGFSTINAVSCQPLRFGKAENSPNNPVTTPAFAAGAVPKTDFDALNAKYEKICKNYDLACRIAVEQADQYKKYVAAHPSKN